MVTRFEGTVWDSSRGRSSDIRMMDTSHLLNIARMLYTCPERIVSMMICDIERYQKTYTAYAPGKETCDLYKQSLQNITGMTAKALIEYVFSSPLGLSLQAELLTRGVNLKNLLSFYGNPFDVQINFITE